MEGIEPPIEVLPARRTCTGARIRTWKSSFGDCCDAISPHPYIKVQGKREDQGLATDRHPYKNGFAPLIRNQTLFGGGEENAMILLLPIRSGYGRTSTILSRA